MSTATLTSKGQTTIPKDIRDHLGLHPGDRLEFVVEENGRVVLLPANIDAAMLEGILAPAHKKVTVEEMNRVIRRRGGAR